MRPRSKPTKAKVEARLPRGKAPKNDDARVRELEDRLAESLKREAEALEQHTATAEILAVISRSPSDVQPVFDAIVQSAVRLCEGFFGTVLRLDGDRLYLAAHDNLNPEGLQAYREHYPVVVNLRETVASGAILDRRVVQVIDSTDPTVPPRSLAMARATGFRGVVVVPMLRDGEPIGVINVARRDRGPFTDRQVALLKTFADQAVIAIENVRLFKESQEKNQALTQAHTQVSEALEQQTATADVLKVISRSTFDLQPVLATLVENATRLAGAEGGLIARFDGEAFRFLAEYGASPEFREYWRTNVIRPGRGSTIGRAAIERRIVHIVDVTADPEHELRDARRISGQRSVLGVPMLRQDDLVGVFFLWRTEVRAFTDKQIELVTTFADQAVIAIENVRLFKELEEKNRALTEAHAQVTETLDRQTATGEILRVISQSPTDAQPVFDTIVRSAVRLCAARFGAVFSFDGELVHLVAHHNFPPDALEFYPMRPSRAQATGRVILSRAKVHLPDLLGDAEYLHEFALASGFRSILAVPMLRDGTPIGTINICRAEAGWFPDAQVELLQTFADQAVIAIENTRLFKELQEKNDALTQAHAQVTDALEQQTATSEILRVISGTPTDVQPVFDAMVSSAARLCDAVFCVAYRFDGALIYPVAHHNMTPDALEALKKMWPAPPSRDTVTARSVLDRSIVHVTNVVQEGVSAASIAFGGTLGGYRTMLAVPMFRDGVPIGTMSVARREERPFTDSQIELLKTFADQAVIAIENVRLFTELQARTMELTRSVGELRALGEVGQAISSTLDLRTVLSTIVARATHLSGTDAGVIYEYDEQREIFLPRATERLEADIVETMLATPVRKGEGATGRLAEVHEPNQVADILVSPADSRVRGALVRAGYRALLAVPLVREDHLLGGLTVVRKMPGEFPGEIIELLQTFATQSALAIQNARLFREIEDKSRQLEVASQLKSEFLANMSHELRTPLNAIIGFSEVLGERMFGELNAKQEEYLKDIHASGQHLLSLINDILDLSKIEAGRMELDLSTFDLPNVIDTAVLLIRERAGRRGIVLQVATDERLGSIQGDERKVKQVLLNLLSNAIKFTPEGGRIQIRTRLVNSSVEVSVADTGVGIAPEDQEAIFEEFRQVGTADKKVEGTGLGLALSRKFIELHGGRIWVQSEPGAGSTFTFTLPRGPA